MAIGLRQRVIGSLYGMATGDALGVPTSFLSLQQVRDRYGWVNTFYQPEKDHRFHAGLKAGEITDDTEQALALATSFVRHGKVVPEDLVEEILNWADRVKGKYVSPLGPSTERALRSIRAGEDLTLSGRYANTNGSAMRISPLGIIHGLRGSTCEELAKDAYLCSMPTHNTQVCSSGAAAIAWGVALCIRGERDIKKIVEGIVRASKIGKQYGFEVPAPSLGRRIEYIFEIVQRPIAPRQVLAELYSMFGGGDLIADSVPIAVGLFVLGKGEPKKVNEYCVNFGGDCDTNAAMAGAMAGAYSGIDAVPAKWIKVVETVNNINLRRVADQLISVSKQWVVADL